MNSTDQSCDLDPATQNDNRDSAPIYIDIARLAYELWDSNNRQTESPDDYWLEAERRLLSRAAPL